MRQNPCDLVSYLAQVELLHCIYLTESSTIPQWLRGGRDCAVGRVQIRYVLGACETGLRAARHAGNLSVDTRAKIAKTYSSINISP